MKMISVFLTLLLLIYSHISASELSQNSSSSKHTKGAVLSKSKKNQAKKSSSKNEISKSQENKSQVSAFDKAVSSLKSFNPYERKSAVEALSSMKDPKAIEHLRQMLKDSDDSVRISAIEGLASLRCLDCEKEISVILSSDKNNLVKQACVTSLLYIGKVSDTAPLMKSAEPGEEKSLRISAIRTLGMLNVRQAESNFISLIKKEKDQDILKALIDALGKMKSSKGLSEIKNFVLNEDPITRQYAIRALGDSGNKEFVDVLKPRLGEENPYVKMEAAYSLAKLGDNSGLSIAYSYLDSADFSLQNMSMQTISLVGDDSSIRMLEEKIKSEKDQNKKTMLEFTLQKLQVRLRAVSTKKSN